jgi:hypothetical protein
MQVVRCLVRRGCIHLVMDVLLLPDTVTTTTTCAPPGPPAVAVGNLSVRAQLAPLLAQTLAAQTVEALQLEPSALRVGHRLIVQVQDRKKGNSWRGWMYYTGRRRGHRRARQTSQPAETLMRQHARQLHACVPLPLRLTT